MVIGTLVIAAVLGGTGCSQVQETATTTTAATATTTTSTTTTSLAASITISGSLASGTVNASAIKALAALSDYKVVAIDNASGQTYYASTDASGGFSFTIPNSVSYEISLIDSNAKYFGPVVMVGNASSSEVVTGIKPTSNVNFGSIVVDASAKMAKPTSEPVSIANFNDKAQATAGVPKGAAADGKAKLTGITTRDSADLDKDGVPNIFDADEDNDGVRNGILSAPKTAVPISATVESVSMDSNIWASHGTTSPARDIMMLRLSVRAKSGKLGEIDNVKVISAPASIKDVAVIRDSSSFGDPTGYPAELTLWKNESYKLYKLSSENTWKVLLNPKGNMNVGDIFTIRVTYTGGSYQDFFLTNSYFMTDWPRLLTYESTAMPTSEGNNQNPVSFTGNSLRFTYSKPKDEDNNILNGLIYSARVGTSELSNIPAPVPNNTVDFPASAMTDNGSAISFTVTTEASYVYYICPVAEANGQRNGEETWFKKQ